jgi:hypothetical protein
MEAIPMSPAVALRNIAFRRTKFYVPTIFTATIGHGIGPPRPALLDFRHRLAFFTIAREPNRSAT